MVRTTTQMVRIGNLETNRNTMKIVAVLVCFSFVSVLATPSFVNGVKVGPAYYKDIVRTNSRIINGHEATKHQFPYQVSLQWSLLGLTYSHICGGSVLTQNWVVTAGHCIQSFGRNRVIAGIVDQGQSDTDVQSRDVSSITIHPGWPGGSSVAPNDIALLFLSSSLTLSSAVQPIALPSAGQSFSGTGILSGWGYASSSPITPTRLRYAEKPILTNEECLNNLIRILGTGTSIPLTDTMICSGDAGIQISACSGDSGGPFVQNGVLVGVVSWGISPCGTANAPSVYTRTSDFVDWIQSSIN